MVSKKSVKPLLTKLVGGRFDGEVFLNHEQADEVLRIDPARIKWGSIYRSKDGEKWEKGMRLLHFIEPPRQYLWVGSVTVARFRLFF